MPKFIYKITIIILIIFGFLYLLMHELSPDLLLNKIIISTLISLILAILSPLTVSIYFLLKKSKEDLGKIFKTTFKKTLLVSFFIGILFFIRIQFELNFYYILIISLTPLLIKFARKRLVKSRKKAKY